MKLTLKFCGCTPKYSNLKQEVRLDLSYKSVSNVPDSLEYEIPIQNIISNGNIRLTWVCLNCKKEVEIKDTFKKVVFDGKCISVKIKES